MTIPLPNEILLNIFQHLPLYSQRQCLQVCKSWNTVAHAFTDDRSQLVEAYSNECIRQLLREVSADPARGSYIQQMHFNLQNRAFQYILPSLFLNLTLACPNLAELVFVNMRSRSYINNLFSYMVDLPKLETIRFGSCELYRKYARDLVHLSLKYRKTINELSLHVDIYDIYNYHNFANYLQHLKNLKCLSLTANCPVVFDAFVTACPQLQVLKLKILNYANFQIMEETTDTVSQQVTARHPVSQLETLKIDHSLLSQDPYDYLTRHCRYLSQLGLYINSDKDVNPLIYTLTAFDQARALPIASLSIDGDLVVTNRLALSLYKWFPHLRQLDITCFDVEASSNDNHYNFRVDLKQLNLSYLSLDISRLFKLNNTPFARVALEVIITQGGTTNITAWYQREEKWKTNKPFILKKSNQFTNPLAKQKRLLSNATAVITVKALNIQRIHVYFNIHKNSFSQVIHLHQ